MDASEPKASTWTPHYVYSGRYRGVFERLFKSPFPHLYLLRETRNMQRPETKTKLAQIKHCRNNNLFKVNMNVLTSPVKYAIILAR